MVVLLYRTLYNSFWIRNPDPVQRGQNTHKNIKKKEKEISCFEVLDVLF
jgi:hypothetical protein